MVNTSLTPIEVELFYQQVNESFHVFCLFACTMRRKDFQTGMRKNSKNKSENPYIVEKCKNQDKNCGDQTEFCV